MCFSFLGVQDSDLQENSAQTNICKMVVEWVETVMLRENLDDVITRVSSQGIVVKCFLLLLYFI